MGILRERGYDCRWRTIDAGITPENRILVGLPLSAAQREEQGATVGLKHVQLQATYARAHRPQLHVPQAHRPQHRANVRAQRGDDTAPAGDLRNAPTGKQASDADNGQTLP